MQFGLGLALQEVNELIQDRLGEKRGEHNTESKEQKTTTSLLQEILGDEENLESIFEKANPQELTKIIESIALRGDIAEFVNHIADIKKSFESKIDPETVEYSLLSRFSTAMARFNKKRMAYFAEREKEKEENSKKKKELLDRLKGIVIEERVTKIEEVREIQNQWRNIGWVLQKDIEPLNNTYRQYLDIFFNLRSQYQELLGLDREYNLEEKKRIVQELDELIPTDDQTTREDWNKRSDRVKRLQESWRMIGHVPREEVEMLNSAFRDALDQFYELHSGYFLLQDDERIENEIKKRAILANIKAHHDFAGNQPKDWNDIAMEVFQYQNEWKSIGPGPIETNKNLWQEYRSECDHFFQRKSNFFKVFDDERGENLIKKTAICERAEAVIGNDDLKETAKILKQLQEEWKNIGPVHERYSNKIWKRFRTACDTFFDRKTASQNVSKNEFEENLRIKLDLISQVEAMVALDNPGDHSEEFESIQAKWKSTGHVPFKQKDIINGAYRDALSLYFEATQSRSGYGGGEHGSRSVRQKGQGIDGGLGKRRKLAVSDLREEELPKIRLKIQAIQENVEAYETNIQLISKGKGGDGLRAQIQSQIDSEKAEIERLKEKVKDLKNRQSPNSSEEDLSEEKDSTSV